MKKSLTRTIIVFVAVSLITAGFAFAQNDPNEALKEEALALRKGADAVRKEASIAANIAQKEAEVAHKQMEAAAKEMQVAQKQMVVAEKQMQDKKSLLQDVREMVEVRLPSVANIRMPAWGRSRSGSSSVLVIPAAQMKAENLAAITEDVSVMSRIFDTKLSQSHLATARGSLFIAFDHFVGHNSGAIEAIYIEGYGALFLMKVNALLSPPPQVQQEEKTEEEDVDPLWTQTRQQMFEPEKVVRKRRAEQPEEKYDAEKIENLKETLIKTLKHAANIRSLKPDESVVLTVIGKAGRSGSIVAKVYTSGENRYVKAETGGAATGSPSPTVMTIRAKKSDIDDFAKGKLTFDQFHEKTRLLSYSYTGGDIGHGSSPSSWPGVATDYDSYSDYSAERSNSRRPESRSSGIYEDEMYEGGSDNRRRGRSIRW